MIKGGRQLLWVGLLRKGVSEVVTLVENEWSEEAGKGEDILGCGNGQLRRVQGQNKFTSLVYQKI